MRLVHRLAALGLLGLSASAQAQQIPRMEGYEVALLGASAFSGDMYGPGVLAGAADGLHDANKAVVDRLMLASRGVGLADIDNLMPRAAYEIAKVDMFDVAAEVPTVEDLLPYDVIFVYNDVPFVDPVAVGDIVATLVEEGKGLILAGNAVDQAMGLQGRFLLQNMAPVTYGTAVQPGGNQQLSAVTPDIEWLVGPTTGHIIDWAVIGTDMGTGSYQVSGLVPIPQAEVTHTWGTLGDEPAVVTLQPAIPGHGRIVVLNFQPVPAPVDPAGWLIGTHVDRLMANAILWSKDFDAGTFVHEFTRPIGMCFDDVNGPQLVWPYSPPWWPPGTTLAQTPIMCWEDSDCCPDGSTDCTNGTNNPNFLPAANPVCVRSQNLSTFQDLNCNGIDVFDEPLFDPNIDPQCLANVDPQTGQPYDNNDYYHDFYRFTCDYVTDGFDADQDQLSQGNLTITPPGNPQVWESVALACDNCGDYYNPNQYDWDFDGVGDECDGCPFVGELFQVDSDEDGFNNACDNCIFADKNPDQWDQDDDGEGDACDNCPELYNPSIYGPGTKTQPDVDFDGAGDVCDNCMVRDLNGDGTPESPGPGKGYDPEIPIVDMVNPDQLDRDDDMWGDLCDTCPDDFNPMQSDGDDDGVGDACDNCPQYFWAEYTDADLDGLGDGCDNCVNVDNIDQIDIDLDKVGDACDNCPLAANEAITPGGPQPDADEDGVGDACDICPDAFDAEQSDADLDGVGDACDNCPDIDNDQEDRDGDGVGDDCDLCPFDANPRDENGEPTNFDQDNDGMGEACDNCPLYANYDQADDDGDKIGNVCDVLGLRGGGELKKPAEGCSTAPAAPGLLALGLGLALIRRRGAAPARNRGR